MSYVIAFRHAKTSVVCIGADGVRKLTGARLFETAREAEFERDERGLSDDDWQILSLEEAQILVLLRAL